MAVSSSSSSSVCSLLQKSKTTCSWTFKTHKLSINQSQFLSSNSCLTLPSTILFPKRFSRPMPVISAVQSNFLRAIQTIIKTGRDGVEAGSKLVPDAIPRPIAKLSVTVVATAVSLFVLRSFVSTVFFTLSFMGFVYFIYLALNKDKGPKVDDKPGSTDEAIEEAKRIMDKYK